MKIKLEMVLDVPDKYLMEGEYENASIHQFVWDHTIHELHVNYLQKSIKSLIQLEKSNDDNIAANTQIHNLYNDLISMIKCCKYTIVKEIE